MSRINSFVPPETDQQNERQVLIMNPFRYLFVAAALAAAMLLITISHAAARDTDTEAAVFTVTGVSVDETAEDAAAARAAALRKARTTAFEKLGERLVPDETRRKAVLADADEQTVSTLIESFEINEEALSDTRYIATLTFYFRPEITKKFFQSRVYGELVTSMPDTVLVLPVIRYSDITTGSVFWGERNPWLAAWQKYDPDRSFVPVRIPAGDTTDLRLAAESDVTRHHGEAIDRLMQRYRATDAVMAIFEVEDASFRYGLLHLYALDGDGMEHVRTVNLDNGENIEGALFTDGIEKTVFYLEDRWQQSAGQNAKQPAPAPSGPLAFFGYGGNTQPVTETNEKAPIIADIAFTNMGEWLAIQKRVEETFSVDDIEVLSLGRNSARTKISFRGSEEQLRRAFGQQGLELAVPVTSAYSKAEDRVYGLHVTPQFYAPPVKPETDPQQMPVENAPPQQLVPQQ